MKFSIGIAALAACLQIARSECPGGCSGNGLCAPRDMCNCFNNYMGNDCAQQICPFGHGHVDIPNGDLNFDKSQQTSGWILTNSQMYPNGGYEWLQPGAVTGEAHFYGECSNQGKCDRTTGMCVCFDGYEGSSCQRQACPNMCSGHGVCRTMENLAAKATGTLFGQPEGNIAASYGLWDAKKIMGCQCDPKFTGPDCSLRNCKAGVDPLYMASGTAIYDTFSFVAAFDPGTGNTFSLLNWVRLRVFDRYGESYITSKIPLVDDTLGGISAAITAFETALLALPNGVITSVSCKNVGTSATFAVGISMTKVASGVGMSFACQFTGNPGKMRLPEIYDSYLMATVSGVETVPTSPQFFIGATTFRGEDIDYCASKSAFTYTSISGTAITVNANAATAFEFGALSLIKIRDQVLLVLTVASLTTVNLKWTYTGIAPTSGSSIYYASGVTVALGDTTVASWTFGSTSLTLTASSSNIVPGVLVFFHNSQYYVRTVSTTTVTVDRGFSGTVGAGADVSTATAIYIITLPKPPTGAFEYVSECSGRGMCNRESGVCSCFKGYTNDNCDTQNILAL